MTWARGGTARGHDRRSRSAIPRPHQQRRDRRRNGPSGHREHPRHDADSRGPNKGTPLAIEGANTHYLALDGLGSPVATINQSGTTTATYTYDPYGQTTTTAQNGSGISSVQIYGYTGGIPDRVNTGLIHLGHRWYDTRTQGLCVVGR